MQVRSKVIVIGSGAAGAALAHRLTAEPDISVLVLEAGPDIRPDVVAIPARWPETLGGPLDWGYRTTPQAGLGGRVIDYARGRILGGSTAINAMIHSLPTAADLQAWGPGWQADDLRGALTALEGHQKADHGRGITGPAVNGPVRQPNPLSVAFVEACIEAGYKRVADLNRGDEDGVGWMDIALTSDGSRADAATVYLRSISERPNLEIRCDARVERLLFDDGRVRALVLRTADGRESELAADDAEVVLSAGSIDSPALLLRSGVGPRDQLDQSGVEVHRDLAGVGANLHDHPLVPVAWRSDRPLDPPTAQFFESQLVLRHDERCPDGVLAVAFGHIAYGVPDVQHGASALVGLYAPHSRGSLRLDPEDPFGSLLIDPALLSDERDRRTAKTGVQVVREIARRAALAPFGLTELLPGAPDADLDEVIPQITGSFMHPVGTCALGDGPMAVVDRDLVVHGFDNLRVADASVYPKIPSAATSATAQMVGWRLAEKMLG